MFGPGVAQAILDHAAVAFPREACGLVIDGVYRPCANLAKNPLTDFAIDPELWSRTVQAVVHSHPDGPDSPTETDMRQQMASAVPWGITARIDEAWQPLFWFGDQIARPELIGRPFRHGVTDCYALIRDYYASKGISLQNWPRSDGWWTRGLDLYQDGFAATGFRRISQADARTGDVVLACIRSPVPNHGGVYLGDGTILHHPQPGGPRLGLRVAQSLSRREPVGPLLKHVTHWLRYDPA